MLKVFRNFFGSSKKLFIEENSATNFFTSFSVFHVCFVLFFKLDFNLNCESKRSDHCYETCILLVFWRIHAFLFAIFMHQIWRIYAAFDILAAVNGWQWFCKANAKCCKLVQTLANSYKLLQIVANFCNLLQTFCKTLQFFA